MARIERKSEFSWDDFPYRKDEEGHPLCRYCKKRLTGRQTAWCSKACTRAVLLMVDWSYIRRTIRRRDKWKCVLCGSRGEEVDHIIEIADGGSYWKPENLRTLCKKCHKKKTSTMKTVRAQRRKLEAAKELDRKTSVDLKEPSIEGIEAIP